MACHDRVVIGLALLASLGGAPAEAAQPLPVLSPDGLMWLGTVTPRSPPPAQRGREQVLVDPVTGELWVEAIDLLVEGSGPTLRIRRVWEGDGWRWSCDEALSWSREGITWRGPDADRLFPPDTPVDLRNIRSSADFPEGVTFGQGVLERTAAGWLLTLDGEERLFDEDGHLLSHRDARGGTLSARWTPQGQLQSLSRADGRAITLTQDPAGHLKTIQGPGGERRTFDTYDGQLIATSDDRGARTRYLYDSSGRLTGILWPDTSTVRIQRDEQGRVHRIAGPGAASLRLDWVQDGFDATDALGRRWSLRRNGESVRVTDPSGAVVTSLYDAGQLSGWIDPRGLSTRVRRDGEGHIILVEAPGSATWRLGWMGDALASLTDPAGGVWRYARDLHGLLTSLTGPAGLSLSVERDTRGDIIGLRRGSANATRLERDLSGRVSSIVSPSGAVTRLRRDGRGRITNVVDPLGNELRLNWRDGPEPDELISRTGARWAFVHDGRGRLIRVETPEADALTLRRDGYGRVIRVILNARAELALSWRSDGALTRVLDTAGRSWGILYDSAARPIQLLRPAASGVLLGYDMTGALDSLGAEDEHIALSRDPRGNPIEVGPWRYTWDNADRLLSVEGPSLLLTLTRNGDGSVRELRLGQEAPVPLARDGAGRAVGLGEGAKATTLVRDSGGQITGISAPQSPTLRFDRDDRGLLIRVAEGESTRAALRDAEGRAIRWSLSDGRATSVDRSPAGAPTLVRFPDGSLTHVSWPKGGGVEVIAEDAAGQIVLDHRARVDSLGRATELLEGFLTRLHRDPLGLLVTTESPRGAWTRTPGFIEGADGTSATLNEAGRPTQSVPPLGPTAWGVGREELRYTLDSQGRVTAVSGEDGTQRVQYDGLCRPVKLSVEGQDSRVIRWDVLGRPVRIDHFGAGTTQLVWGLDGLLSATDSADRAEVIDEPGWGWTFAGAHTLSLHADASGSPRVWLDEGRLYERLTWSPTGSSAEHLPLIGWRDTVVLGDGGPYLDARGGWDPLSGTPLCPRWSPPGAIPLSHPAPWPVLDTAATPPWDPEPWQTKTTWNQPLELLVALGELAPLVEGRWLDGAPEPPPLPWLPAAAATPAPPLWPGWSALPLDLDPITELALYASLPQPRPLDTRALIGALLEQELGDQTLFDSAVDPRAHRWWEDILIPGELIGWNYTLDY